MKRVPVLDPTSNQQFALEGESTELVPRSQTVYIDRHGNTYDPQQKDVRLHELPIDGVMELPRTTWWQEQETEEESARETAREPDVAKRFRGQGFLRIDETKAFCFGIADQGWSTDALTHGATRQQ